MADELVFYTHPMSRGRIVRWMLEEVGAPYETELLDYASTMKAPDYLAINPMGKVPAIRHGDTIVTEAAAICTYLADAFPEAGLSPRPGGPERGAFYRWMFFGAGPVETAALVKALNATVPEDRTAMAGYGTHAMIADVLERLVSANDYILGDRFSAVDVYLGSQIGWGV
jgi:glutathione S-transferase